jgi:hypothetical protein
MMSPTMFSTTTRFTRPSRREMRAPVHTRAEATTSDPECQASATSARLPDRTARNSLRKTSPMLIRTETSAVRSTRLTLTS